MGDAGSPLVDWIDTCLDAAVGGIRHQVSACRPSHDYAHVARGLSLVEGEAGVLEEDDVAIGGVAVHTSALPVPVEVLVGIS